MSDLIDRQAAITALSNEIVKRRLLDEMYDGCIDEFQTEEILKKLPPANNSEIPNSSDTISRQAVKDILDKYQLRYHIYPYVWDAINELPPAQPEPDQNGDLWITVPDIDKVTCIYVQESKSKFCRIFYEEQPERIKGHWITMEKKNLFRCSECSAVIYSESEYDRNEFHKFCGRCGAEMEVTT